MKGKQGRRPSPTDERIHWFLWPAAALAIYVSVAMCVFRWRHPWMTQTECGAYFLHVLTFDRVTESEVREWEGRR